MDINPSKGVETPSSGKRQLITLAKQAVFSWQDLGLARQAKEKLTSQARPAASLAQPLTC